MYIKSYKSKRFAGLKDTHLEFEEGLNVVLGPNESGKSTIVDGIQSTLFKNIRLRKNNNADINFDFKYMPKPSGDFIDGKVTIKNKDGKHKIYRQWGSTEDIEFVNSDGNIFKDEKEIDKEILNLLGYGESTYSNIVFAKQSDLKEALDNIIKNSKVTDEISDLLRRTMMELDGISIDKLEKDIEKEIDELYKRWDRDKNYPQNNRGVNNPYKSGLGKIIKSYYNKENLALKMETIEKNEIEFEKICDKIKKLEDAIEPLEKKKNSLEEIEDDVNDRTIIEMKIDNLDKELEDLLDANKNWPRIEQLLGQYDEKIDNFKEERKKLKEEEKNIEKEQRKIELEKKLQTIEEINSEIVKLRENKEEIPFIEKESIDELVELKNKINTIRTSMEAGKILGNLKKQGKEVYIKRDLGELEEVKLGERFEANGFLNIIYGDNFEIEIKTGEIDFEELNKKYNNSKTGYKNLLKKFKISSVEEGKLNHAKLTDIKNRIKEKKNKRDFYLADMKLEELEEKIEELKEVKVVRTLDEIEGRFEEMNRDELDLLSKRNSESEKVGIWKEKYENHDKLLDIIMEKKVLLKEQEGSFKDLKPLPDEFKNAEEFKVSLSETKRKLKENKDELELIRPDYYLAKNNISEISYEEVKKEQMDAQKEFEGNVKRGQKLDEIKKVFLNTKEKLSTNPMKTLVDEFARLLEIITDGDYKQGEIDEDFNIKLKNKNGEIPVELLSAGTYDSVALALRFSLLKHIFQDEDGYVVLDDCLVDLDPIRKRESIKLINEFAKDYQIIFTTCDPETANMLGGNIILI